MLVHLQMGQQLCQELPSATHIKQNPIDMSCQWVVTENNINSRALICEDFGCPCLIIYVTDLGRLLQSGCQMDDVGAQLGILNQNLRSNWTIVVVSLFTNADK